MPPLCYLIEASYIALFHKLQHPFTQLCSNGQSECNLNLIIGKMTVFSFQFASFKHQLFTEGLQKSGMYYSIRHQFCECCLILLECLYFNKCFIENSESEKCKL